MCVLYVHSLIFKNVPHNQKLLNKLILLLSYQDSFHCGTSQFEHSHYGTKSSPLSLKMKYRSSEFLLCQVFHSQGIICSEN